MELLIWENPRLCRGGSRGLTYEGVSIPETSDRERSSGRECGVILSPVGGLVAGLWLPGFTHVAGLPVQWGRFVQQSRFTA